MELIDKSALVAEIEKVIEEPAPPYDSQCRWEDGYYCGLYKAESIIDTLEVEEVDLEQEKDEYWNKLCDDEFGELLERDAKWFDDIAKYFFELGLKVNNPTTVADRGIAEEIIVNLKRVEQDYCINLTKEMQWLRDIVNKGE